MRIIDRQDFYEYAKNHPLCVEVYAIVSTYNGKPYLITYRHPKTKKLIFTHVKSLPKFKKLADTANKIIFDNNLITLFPYKDITNILSDSVILGSQENLDILTNDFINTLL